MDGPNNAWRGRRAVMVRPSSRHTASCAMGGCASTAAAAGTSAPAAWDGGNLLGSTREALQQGGSPLAVAAAACQNLHHADRRETDECGFGMSPLHAKQQGMAAPPAAAAATHCKRRHP